MTIKLPRWYGICHTHIFWQAFARNQTHEQPMANWLWSSVMTHLNKTPYFVPVSQLCSWWHDLGWSNLGTTRSARVLTTPWPCRGLCGPDALAHVFCNFASSCIEVCFWWSWQKWDSTCSILFRSWLLVPVSQLCSWWHDLSWSNLGTTRSARVLTTHLALSWPMRAWRARTFVLQFCTILHWSLLLVILALQGTRQYLQPTRPFLGLCGPDLFALLFCKSCSILLRSWLLVPVSQLCSWWHDLSWSNLGTTRSARVLTTHLALSWPMRAWRARTCVLQFCIILHRSLLLMILAEVRQYLLPTRPFLGLCGPDLFAHVFCK